MKVLYSREKIQKRVSELAKDIARDMHGNQIVLVCVLQGAFILTADLLRALHDAGMENTQVEFLGISSYTSGKKPQTKPTIISDLTMDIRGKHVVIVEDIVDTGHTMHVVQHHLNKRKPATLRTLAFLDKKDLREVEIVVDYIGFILAGKQWVEGYGLDTDQLGRGIPYIVEKSV